MSEPAAAPATFLDAELAEVTRRIARAIDAAQAAPPEAAPKLVVLHAAGMALALPLRSVREVVDPSKLSPVPRAPEAVLGIMNLRGRVVVVVDLALTLPADAWKKAGRVPTPRKPGLDLPSGRILIAERGRREVGLLVESVEGIARAEDAHAVLLDIDEIAKSVEAMVE